METKLQSFFVLSLPSLPAMETFFTTVAILTNLYSYKLQILDLFVMAKDTYLPTNFFLSFSAA